MKDEKEKKSDEQETEERVDKAFGKWVSLKEKSGAMEGVKPLDEWFPSVTVKCKEKAPELGKDVDVEFKAEVSRVEKTKDGNRITLELKEVKFK